MKIISDGMINKTVGLEQEPVANNVTKILNSPGVLLNSREARNLAEKNRRDKLNASIQELATMVPHAAEATKRLDKTAVLRFATHGLRLRYVFGKTNRRRKHLDWSNKNTDSLLKLLDSFLITLTCSGQILLVSSSVENLLGHCQSDLYGQNILQITHPDDHEILRQQLIPNDIEALFSRHSTTDNHEQNSNSSCSENSLDSEGNEKRTSRRQRYLNDIDKRLKEDRRTFTIRLARASTRSEAIKQYEIVKIDGSFRRSDFTSSTSSCYPIVSQLIRRSRSSMQMDGTNGTDKGSFAQQFIPHDAIAQAALHGISGNDIVLVGMAKILMPPSISTRLIEANSLEYKTRHLIDGRIVECDQRISLVAGYMKDEVRNLSPFSFMHQDDVRWVIVALRQMYDCNSNYGESCYRLLSRNGNFIYLYTKGFMEVDKVTNKIHSFICINTLLNEEEGKKMVKAMKEKFSTIIKGKIPINSTQDLPASQNPQQLEKIVLYLIENLQKRNDTQSSVTLTELPSSPKEFRSTQPLSLVPPEPESVKTSISKSVNLVNNSAAKTIVLQQKQNQSRQQQSSKQNIENHSQCIGVNKKSYNDYKHVKTNIFEKFVPKLDSDMTDIFELPEELMNENSSLKINFKSLDREAQRPTVLQMLTSAKRHSSSIENPQKDVLDQSNKKGVHESVTPTLARLLSQPVKLNNQDSNSQTTYNLSNASTGNPILKRVLTAKPIDGSISSNLDHSPAKRSIGSQISLATSLSTVNAASGYSSGNLSSSPSFSLYSTDSPLSAFSILPSSSPEIHHVLSESFENLDFSLNSIDENARILCKRSSVPVEMEHELDDILLENEKHKELLINIKSEYDDYLHQQHLANLLNSPSTSPTTMSCSSLGDFQINHNSL